MYLKKRVKTLGSTLLILDALEDAVEDLDERPHVMKLFKDITRSVPGVHILFTSRMSLPEWDNVRQVQVRHSDAFTKFSLFFMLRVRLLNVLYTVCLPCCAECKIFSGRSDPIVPL